MRGRFRAILIDKRDNAQQAELVTLTPSELMPGDVTVAVSHSTVNYKDGLALTGRAPVVRRLPMIPGIDFAGTVEESADPAFKRGDAVLANGWGLSETHFGGYAELARVKSEWLIPLPREFQASQAMAIGTAGYTAMLSVIALEDAGLAPGKGPVLVTCASGGVGSVAITLLATLGYSVIASTGRMQEADYLKELGAHEIISRDELSGEPKPLAKERWAGGIDSVGSRTLANVLASTKYGGAVAACGLAQGMDLPVSVAPFILRGVSLLGVDSVQTPIEDRRETWTRLAGDLRPPHLEDALAIETDLDGLEDALTRILAGKISGRTIVRL